MLSNGEISQQEYDTEINRRNSKSIQSSESSEEEKAKVDLETKISEE